jgi:hypothetical protein
MEALNLYGVGAPQASQIKLQPPRLPPQNNPPQIQEMSNEIQHEFALTKNQKRRKQIKINERESNHEKSKQQDHKDIVGAWFPCIFLNRASS